MDDKRASGKKTNSIGRDVGIDTPLTPLLGSDSTVRHPIKGI